MKLYVHCPSQLNTIFYYIIFYNIKQCYVNSVQNNKEIGNYLDKQTNDKKIYMYNLCYKDTELL